MIKLKIKLIDGTDLEYEVNHHVLYDIWLELYMHDSVTRINMYCIQAYNARPIKKDSVEENPFEELLRNNPEEK